MIFYREVVVFERGGFRVKEDSFCIMIYRGLLFRWFILDIRFIYVEFVFWFRLD